MKGEPCDWRFLRAKIAIKQQRYCAKLALTSERGNSYVHKDHKTRSIDSGKYTSTGDKSISHRALMLSSIANGDSVITGLSQSADVQSTINCLRALGIELEIDGNRAVVHGREN